MISSFLLVQVLLLDQVGGLSYSMTLVMGGSRACRRFPLEHPCLALGKVGLRGISLKWFSIGFVLLFVKAYSSSDSHYLGLAGGVSGVPPEVAPGEG